MANSSFDKKIEKYEPTDQDGFSSKELRWSFWFVSHKLLLRTIGIAILMVIDILLVGWALFGFGGYLLGGQTNDQNAALQIFARLQQPPAKRIQSAAAQPLILGDPQIFSSGNEKVDYAVTAENPNQQWYALVTFAFDIPEASSTPTRTQFILPGEKKLLTILGEQRAEPAPVVANLAIKDVQWRRISPHTVSDVAGFLKQRNAFSVTNATFVAAGAASPSTGNQIKFTLHNDTAYNFWSVPVQIALVRAGTLVGVEEYAALNFKTGETRDIELRNFVAGLQADEVLVNASVDVFDQSVYMSQ